MRLLLDTHLLLWTAGDCERLPLDARQLIADGDNDIFFNVASLWEIVIKTGVRRADFAVDARDLRRNLLENEFDELQVGAEHVLAVASLPMHKDPFDRLLVAQSHIEKVTLLTVDRTLARYSDSVRVL